MYGRVEKCMQKFHWKTQAQMGRQYKMVLKEIFCQGLNSLVQDIGQIQSLVYIVFTAWVFVEHEF